VGTIADPIKDLPWDIYLGLSAKQGRTEREDCEVQKTDTARRAGLNLVVCWSGKIRWLKGRTPDVGIDTQPDCHAAIVWL